MSHPYRDRLPSPPTEEELWLSLDCALEEALRDPHLSWSLTWNIIMDAQEYGYPAVEVAAVSLLHELNPLPPEWDLPRERIVIRDP